MQAKNWQHVSEIFSKQESTIVCLESVRAVPSYLWNTRDTMALEDKAEIRVNKVTEDTWPSIVANMAPFMLHMCENPHVQKIGVYCADKAVNLLVDPLDGIALESVVNAYCGWQEDNPHIPYFEVRTVGVDTFSSREVTYNIVVEPKR